MSAITPLLCSCIVCRKLTSHLGLQTHVKRSHGSIVDKKAWENSILSKKNEKEQNISEYKKNPNECRICNKVLTYEVRYNKFCSHSCSANFTNRERINNGWEMSLESKNKISEKLSKIHKKPVSQKTSWKNNIVGVFSKIFFCTCKKCSLKFVEQTPKRLCFSCKRQTQRATDIYKFSFNVYDYPDLFDLSLIEKHGWFSQGGKKRKIKNINGVSRDHRVSVSEALKNNYDPYYITHVCNCQLMLHSVNNKKKGRSSISYEELKKIVDLYDGAKSGI